MLKMILCFYVATLWVIWTYYYLFVPDEQVKAPRSILEFLTGLLLIPLIFPLMILRTLSE